MTRTRRASDRSTPRYSTVLLARSLRPAAAALTALLTAALLPFTSTGTAEAAPSAPASAGVPTMLILDASGSMIRDAPGGGTRMAQARAAATTFVSALADGQTLGLMVFGTGTGNKDSDKPAGCRDVKTLAPLGPVDKAALTQTIAGIRESGYTPLGLAVEQAAQQIGDQAASIVLVSDGVDSCAPPPSCDRVAQVKKDHPSLTIHAIGFAVDADEQAQEELNCIAKTGGGSYVTASNAAQLAAQLKWVADPSLLQDTVAPGGVNGLQLGMSIDEALAAEPSATVTDPTVEVVYLNCDYATGKFVNGELAELYPKQSWPTASGLAVGAPITAADDLYGAPWKTGTGKFGTYNTYPVTQGSAYAYRVYHRDGLVVKIVVCTCGPNSAPSTGVNGSGGGAFDVEASLAGIDSITLGMTQDEALAAYPALALYEGGEGAPYTAFPLTPENVQKFTSRTSDGSNSYCPTTEVPFERNADGPFLQVYMVEGRVQAVHFDPHGMTGRSNGSFGNGLTSTSTKADIEAVYGRVSEFKADPGHDGTLRYVAVGQDGRTIQFVTGPQGVGIAQVLAAEAPYTWVYRPKDFFPCVAIMPRQRG